MNKGIINYLKNSIDEKGNYCYSLPVETTKAVIKELNRLNNIIDELEKEVEQLENIRKETIELIKKYQRKDEFLNLNEWQTRDLLNILNKGDNNE